YPAKTTLCHAFDHDVMQVQRSIKVYSNDLVPKGAIGFQKGDRDIPAGDIGKQLNRPCSGFKFVCRSSDRIAIGDIDLKREHAAALAGAEMNGLVRARQILVEYTNHATFVGQSKRRRAPDPAGPTGQDNSSPIKPAHTTLPFSCPFRLIGIVGG